MTNKSAVRLLADAVAQAVLREQPQIGYGALITAIHKQAGVPEQIASAAAREAWARHLAA